MLSSDLRLPLAEGKFPLLFNSADVVVYVVFVEIILDALLAVFASEFPIF